MNDTQTTTTTQVTAEQYAAALARAERDGVQVIQVEATFATVYSPKSIAAYTVAIYADRMVCDCEARGYCKHRAAVRETLVAARAAADAADDDDEGSWSRYANCCGNDADRGW